LISKYALRLLVSTHKSPHNGESSRFQPMLLPRGSTIERR